jgi:hypothetical protein
VIISAMSGVLTRPGQTALTRTPLAGVVESGARAEALFAHDLQLVLHREEHAAHVGGEHQVEGLDRVVDERVRVVAAVDAGAVDRDIEAPVVTGSDLDRVADGILVVDVGDDVLALAAGFGHELDGLLEAVRGPTGDGDLVAFG